MLSCLSLLASFSSMGRRTISVMPHLYAVQLLPYSHPSVYRHVSTILRSPFEPISVACRRITSSVPLVPVLEGYMTLAYYRNTFTYRVLLDRHAIPTCSCSPPVFYPFSYAIFILCTCITIWWQHAIARAYTFCSVHSHVLFPPTFPHLLYYNYIALLSHCYPCILWPLLRRTIQWPVFTLLCGTYWHIFCMHSTNVSCVHLHPPALSWPICT